MTRNRRNQILELVGDLLAKACGPAVRFVFAYLQQKSAFRNRHNIQIKNVGIDAAVNTSQFENLLPILNGLKSLFERANLTPNRNFTLLDRDWLMATGFFSLPDASKRVSNRSGRQYQASQEGRYSHA